jgi:branched-subunit amino acid transport protein
MGVWVSRHATWCLIIFSAAYWFVVLRRAAHEVFTFDEIVIWRIARLPSVAAIWQSVLAGLDQKLILNHLLVRLSHSLLGPSHLSSRFPSALGFWICLLSLYVLLRRYVAVPYALAGMIFPALTIAWGYALEGSAYGVLLGAAAAVMVCWQTATCESRLRRPALVGITLTLAIALSTHMMAAMLALPLAIGESIRSWERRRIDLPVWAAFGLAAPFVLVYPVVLAAAPTFDLRNLYPTPARLPAFYAELLKPAVFAILAAALAVYLMGRESDQDQSRRLPRHLVAALVALAAQPALFIAIAFFLRQLFFTPRYGLLAGIGLAALLAAGASYVCRGSLRSGMAILIVIAGWFFVTKVPPVLRRLPSPEATFAGEYPLLREAVRGNLPVVVSDPTAFWLSAFYWPQAEAVRLHFVTDHENAWRSGEQDINQQLMSRYAVHFLTPESVQPYSTFLQKNRKFVVYVNDERPPRWLYYLLARDRDRCIVTLQDHSGGESLFTVDVAP